MGLILKLSGRDQEEAKEEPTENTVDLFQDEIPKKFEIMEQEMKSLKGRYDRLEGQVLPLLNSILKGRVEDAVNEEKDQKRKSRQNAKDSEKFKYPETDKK